MMLGQYPPPGEEIVVYHGIVVIINVLASTLSDAKPNRARSRGLPHRQNPWCTACFSNYTAISTLQLRL
jgi:hypothetical protein